MSAKPEIVEENVKKEMPIDPLTGKPFTEEEWARRKRFGEKMRALKGKLHLNIDLDELRGRNRS
jgi:hypothetical protein